MLVIIKIPTIWLHGHHGIRHRIKEDKTYAAIILTIVKYSALKNYFYLSDNKTMRLNLHRRKR